MKTIQISDEDLQTIGGALEQMPFRIAAPTIGRLNAQLQAGQREEAAALGRLRTARSLMYEQLVSAYGAGGVSPEAWATMHQDPDFLEWERQQAARKEAEAAAKVPPAYSLQASREREDSLVSPRTPELQNGPADEGPELPEAKRLADPRQV